MDEREPEKEAKILELRKEAKELTHLPEATKKLGEEAQKKARSSKFQHRVQSFREELERLIQMIKAWASGQYSAIPWETLFWSIFAVLYFLSPVDLVPDFLPITGLLDDGLIIRKIFTSLKADLDKFKAWQQNTKQSFH